MKVCIVSDTIDGGAARSTGRLIDTLNANSVDIERWFFAPKKQGNPDFYISLDPRRKRPPFERFIKNVSKPWANQLRASRHESQFLESVSTRKPSLINVRNIHTCGLSHKGLLSVPKNIPLVWTMHDAWPFATEAFRWDNSKLGQTEYAVADRPIEEAKAKREKLFDARKDLVLVGPSKWLCREAEANTSLRVEHIPNGITTDEFQPMDKASSKAELGLSNELSWIAFGATWANSRKGTDVFIDALEKLDSKSIGLMCWGGEIEEKIPDRFTVRHFGRISNDQELRKLYSAADIFICPSRADNLPNTILESMSCGTPAIGSRVGGIPDMIIPGSTGWLYEGDSPDNCAGAIMEALDAKTQWPEYSQNARKLAVNEFDVSIAAQRYTKLYNELLPT